MDSTTTVLLGTKGQTVCHPTTVIDVLKFFVFNFGLHVLTVVTSPGSKAVPNAIRAVGALLLPFSGTYTALDVIHRFARGQSGDLNTAHRAGALCMLLPTKVLNESAQHVYRQLTHVHGQHPVLPQSTFWVSIRTTVAAMYHKQRAGLSSGGRNPRGPFGECIWKPCLVIYRKVHANLAAINPRNQSLLQTIRDVTRILFMTSYIERPVRPATTNTHGRHMILQEFDQILEPGMNGDPIPELSLIVVPKSFTVAPFSDADFTPLTLSCNYSIPKAIVAIIQVGYGSVELYHSSIRQLPRFGYASYSLTVVPYLIMTVVNLVATACEPQYPTMFLVCYGGDSRTASVQRRTSSDSEETVETDVQSHSPTMEARTSEQVRAAVGYAYGSLHENLSGNQPFKGRESETVSRWIIFRVGGFCLIGIPYLTIFLLTQFESRDSTELQRGFILTWLILGHAYGWVLYSLRGNHGLASECLNLGMALVFGTGAIGGFVVVGKMMLDSEVCTIL